MDFKTKGKSWVGNIYHQFEAICQDVDDFMGKDTVRFVENQVQTVGVSVKKIYSHVVQDVLPPSADNVEAKSPLTADKQVDIREPPLEQVPIDCLINSNVTSQINIDPVTQFADPSCLHSSQNAKNDVTIWADGNVVIWEDANSKNSDGVAVEKERISCVSSSDDSEYLSITSRLTIVDDSISSDNISLSPSEDKFHEENFLNVDSLYSTACDAATRPLSKDRILFVNVSTKDESFDVPGSVQSPNLAFSYFSCDDEETQMGITPSNCSTMQKFLENLEPAPTILIQLVDHTSSSSLESNDGTDVPNLSSPTEAGITKATDKPDDNEFATNGLVSEDDSSESRHEEWIKGALPNLTTPPENYRTDGFSIGVTDVGMETVDLSSKVKPDGTSGVPNITFAHSTSYRRKNIQYYKKLLQEAFSSRKRLSKEYEHLDILYGDIDAESGRHFEPSSLPSSPIVSVQTGGTLSFHEPCESGWELL